MRQEKLIDVDKYTELAQDQLKQIKSGPQPPKPFALSATEWRITAAIWLLIRIGVYLPMLERKMLKRLQCNNTRNECESWIRTHSYSLREAAEIAYCEEDLERYENVESRKPILQG